MLVKSTSSNKISLTLLMDNLWTRFVCNIALIILPFLSDTENIRFVFAAVKDTILQLNLKEYNLV